ncbi:N-acetylmuramoyl-L-alanine amidase [Chishuiella changwenlii]|jgi:N-acetylmuramoyl-L-alanine amidase|uniref:N-acetylmuramoyl-L-alanine amidase family protein n=1 Tax=Chishuiella changwenlii TaxID=1434701 RepID=UPI002FDB962F
MKKLFAITLLFIIGNVFGQTTTLDSIPTKKRIILLDAGHGGTDTGVKEDGFEEKNIVLKIAKVIKDENPFDDVEFVLLRQDDEQIINTNRANMINEIKPDLVLSIHANYNVKNTKKGTEVHISPMNPHFEESKKLGEIIEANITALGLENLGIIETNSKILRDSKVPIIMLEIGYLTNNDDRKFLIDENNYPKIAQKIYQSLR